MPRAFYARNISSLLLHFVKDGALNLDFDDEITAATVITHDGAGRPGGHEEAARAGAGARPPEVPRMSPELLNSLAIFVLAILVGFEVISKVPATLHTPADVGRQLDPRHRARRRHAHRRRRRTTRSSYLLAFVAMVFGAANVVGGYVVTDRMLQMFRKKPTAPKADPKAPQARILGEGPTMSLDWIYTIVYLAWLGGAACFVLGLHQMNSPATARNGNRFSAAGMTLAVVATLVWLVTPARAAWRHRPGRSSSSGFAIGGGAGLYLARTVKMTAMPQLVSLFNAVGGGAAALVAIDDYIRRQRRRAPIGVDTAIFVVLGAVIGSVTFTGSLIAGGKLQGIIPGKPIIVPGGAARDRVAWP